MVAAIEGMLEMEVSGSFTVMFSASGPAAGM